MKSPDSLQKPDSLTKLIKERQTVLTGLEEIVAFMNMRYLRELSVPQPDGSMFVFQFDTYQIDTHPDHLDLREAFKLAIFHMEPNTKIDYHFADNCREHFSVNFSLGKKVNLVRAWDLEAMKPKGGYMGSEDLKVDQDAQHSNVGSSDELIGSMKLPRLQKYIDSFRAQLAKAQAA